MKNKPQILVIDDDDDLRELLCLVLSQEGYDVESYSSPDVALENLRLGKHLPKLMVVDFQMDGMLGTEFIRSAKVNCPVMMISSSPEEVESVDKHLFEILMPKPLDMKSLLENLKTFTA